MSYVWTPEKVARYRGYFHDLRTHHTYMYATFATDAEFARSVLPPCLEPAEQPAVTVSVGAFMEWLEGVPNREGRDRAALIGINARYGGEEGMYYLTVIENEEVNISTGREFWGMPKKQGAVEFFEDGEQIFALVERKGHQLIEMQGQLGEPAQADGEETEIYFELRGNFGPTADDLARTQLAVFENRTLMKRIQPVTEVEVKLRPSPFDPGVATIPLGEQLDGGSLGGETSYIVREIVDLDGDGNDYAPYLLGRLYDEFPDVLEVEDRVVGRPGASALSG